jgi:hypothetical protein
MKIVRQVLSDLASLSNPTTALALVALIVQFLPGVNIPGTALAGILGGVGLIASFVQRLLEQAGGNILAAVKLAVADVALLRNPSAAAAVVALVVQLIPGVSINGQAVAGILGGIGVVAAFVAAQIAAAKAKPAPAPVPTPAAAKAKAAPKSKGGK